MAEFDLIERIRSRVPAREDVVLGIGDDAAVVRVPADRQLVVCTDTLNAGVHFPHDTAPADIGWKSLAVNLSDLAAMGAQPAWCTLSLSMPADDPAWLDGFLDGFLELAQQHGVALIGGDTTRGPLSISVTAHGLVQAGCAVRRDGAQAGDDVWVSGTLGDAAAALAMLSEADHAREASTSSPANGRATQTTPHLQVGVEPTVVTRLRQRLDRPQPRVALGLQLADIANAAIDISDGLWSDLGHVCRASGLGAVVELDALPSSPWLMQGVDADVRRNFQAAGGDDYELCFTASVSVRPQIASIAAQTGTALTRIGRMVRGVEVSGVDAGGGRWQPSRTGWVHFSD